MKNLLNKGINLEKIEMLPSRLRWRFTLDSKFNVKDDYHKFRWENNAQSLIYDRVHAIIRGSVGQNWNDVFSKISKIVNKLPFDINTGDVVNVHFCYWDIVYQEWWLKPYKTWSRPLAPLDAYVNKLLSDKYYYKEFLYVHPETNILMSVLPKSYPKQTREQVRQNYEKKNARRKANRKYYKERRSKGINELKMINNKPLLDFYVSLVKERDLLLTRLNSKPEKYPSSTEQKYDYTTGKYNTISVKRYNDLCRSWRLSEALRKVKQAEAEVKYPAIQEQVERLESGDFGGYFSSNVYLYSLQKECHHFAQP